MTQQLIVKRIIILKRIVFLLFGFLGRLLGALGRLLGTGHTGGRDIVVIRGLERIALVRRLLLISTPFSLQRTYRSPLGLLLLHLGGLLLRSSLFALLDARVVELAALLEGRVVAHHEEVEQADDNTDRAHDDVQDAQAIRIGSGATEHHGHRAGG